MEGLWGDGHVKESGVSLDGDDNGFVGDVCCILSRHETSPVEVDVMLLFIDEGGEEVEVVVSGMCSDKDNPIVRSKSEYSGGGEAMVAEVGVLLGTGLGGVGRHDGGWCHGLPPFLPNLFFPFLYLTLGRLSLRLPNLPMDCSCVF